MVVAKVGGTVESKVDELAVQRVALSVACWAGLKVGLKVVQMAPWTVA